MGELRRQKPPEVVGISEGSGLLMELSSAGMYSKDFDLFNCRPREGPSSSTILSALARSAAEPHSVPSSKYQALMEPRPLYAQ